MCDMKNFPEFWISRKHGCWNIIINATPKRSHISHVNGNCKSHCGAPRNRNQKDTRPIYKLQTWSYGGKQHYPTQTRVDLVQLILNPFSCGCLSIFVHHCKCMLMKRFEYFWWHIQMANSCTIVIWQLSLERLFSLSVGYSHNASYQRYTFSLTTPFLSRIQPLQHD